MARITRFVSKYGTYTFPNTEQDFRDNFADVLARASRLPGVDGGLDEYGTGHAPSPVGLIQFGVYLVSRTREGMQVLRDNLRLIRTWGTGKLYYQPTNTALEERWAWCRVNNINTSQRLEAHTDIFQPVQVTMQASEPYWHALGDVRRWGSFNWGGADWGGDFVTQNVSSLEEMVITNPGNAFTLPKVVVRNQSGADARNIRIERLVNDVIVDSVRWAGTLADDDWLMIDSRRQRVTRNGYNTLDGYFEYLRPDWLRLMPGTNTLRIRLDGTADFYVNFLERYV